MIRIPYRWTPEEALLMAAFLNAIVDAIWQLHGDGMARLLQQEYRCQDVTAAVGTHNLDRSAVSRSLRHEQR